MRELRSIKELFAEDDYLKKGYGMTDAKKRRSPPSPNGKGEDRI
ncbi:hypothetical protein [Hartmannibacter diazotrophicus]|nr:hypothetical protein [Hartmannibacter diazotrophicus]